MPYQAIYDPHDTKSPVSEGPQPKETARLFREGALLMLQATEPEDYFRAVDKFAAVVAIGNPSLFDAALQAQVDCAINARTRGPRTIDDKF